MKKLTGYSQKTQEYIRNCEQKYQINLKQIIERCGVWFTVKLLRHLTPKRPSDKTHLFYPESIEKKFELARNEQNPNKKRNKETHARNQYTKYINTLRACDLKFHEWSEKYYDEDTGEPIVIERIEMYCLNRKIEQMPFPGW
jgi:hypothetical protein